jgi:3-dehydroquinate synthase
MSPSSSLTVSSSSDQTSSLGGGSTNEGEEGENESNDDDDDDDDVERVARKHEKCPVSGADVYLSPLERAPENVFAFTKTHTAERTDVVKTPASTITTTTKVVSTSRGWRNVFSLPISYDVNMVSHGTIFDPGNSQLMDATGVHPEGYDTRFAVVDAAVDALYGDRIRAYFGSRGIVLTTCVIDGGEADKRPAVSFSPRCIRSLP